MKVYMINTLLLTCVAIAQVSLYAQGKTEPTELLTKNKMIIDTKLKISADDEENILMLLDDFQVKESCSNDYKLFETNKKHLINKIDQILVKYETAQIPEKISQKIKNIIDMMKIKYREKVLQDYGLLMNDGLYHVYFKVEANFHGNLTVGYAIIDLNKFHKLTNIYLTLLNDRGLEITKYFVGNVSDEIVIGVFQIPESDFKEIESAKLCTEN